VIPLLHGQRVDVLHALALVAGGHEPLPEGLTRLAEGDPLLAPWAQRLAPPLRQGQPLTEVLRRARLINGAERALLDDADDVPAALAQLAASAAAPPRGLVLVRWLPTALVLAGCAGCAIGLLVTLPMSGMAGEISSRNEVTVAGSLLSLVGAVAAVALVQALLAQVRGLRHILHLWCPAVHRASAWRDFVQAVRLGDEPVTQPAFLAFLATLRLTAQRQDAPVWDLPWRTWLMLSRWRMPRALRRRLAAEPSGRARLDLLGGEALAAADEGVALAVDEARPLLLSALWMTGIAGVLVGLTSGPLRYIFTFMQQL